MPTIEVKLEQTSDTTRTESYKYNAVLLTWSFLIMIILENKAIYKNYSAQKHKANYLCPKKILNYNVNCNFKQSCKLSQKIFGLNSDCGLGVDFQKASSVVALRRASTTWVAFVTFAMTWEGNKWFTLCTLRNLLSAGNFTHVPSL